MEFRTPYNLRNRVFVLPDALKTSNVSNSVNDCTADVYAGRKCSDITVKTPNLTIWTMDFTNNKLQIVDPESSDDDDDPLSSHLPENANKKRIIKTKIKESQVKTKIANNKLSVFMKKKILVRRKSTMSVKELKREKVLVDQAKSLHVKDNPKINQKKKEVSSKENHKIKDNKKEGENINTKERAEDKKRMPVKEKPRDEKKIEKYKEGKGEEMPIPTVSKEKSPKYHNVKGLRERKEIKSGIKESLPVEKIEVFENNEVATSKKQNEILSLKGKIDAKNEILENLKQKKIKVLADNKVAHSKKQKYKVSLKEKKDTNSKIKENLQKEKSDGIKNTLNSEAATSIKVLDKDNLIVEKDIKSGIMENMAVPANTEASTPTKQKEIFSLNKKSEVKENMEIHSNNETSTIQKQETTYEIRNNQVERKIEMKSMLPVEKRLAKRTGIVESMDELEMIKKELNEDDTTIIEVKKQYRLLGTIDLIDEDDEEQKQQIDEENNREQNNVVIPSDEADSGRESCPLENVKSPCLTTQNDPQSPSLDGKSDPKFSLTNEEPMQPSEAHMVEQTVETELVTDNMEFTILNMTPEEYAVNRFYYGDEFIQELAVGQIEAVQPVIIEQVAENLENPGVIVIDDDDEELDSKAHLQSSLLLSPDEEMQVGKIARMPQIKEFVQLLAQRSAVLDHHVKQIEKLKVLGCVKPDDSEILEKKREEYHKKLLKCIAEFYFMMRDLSCLGKERVYRDIYERLELVCKKVDVTIKRNEMFVEKIIDEYNEMNKGNEFKKLLESEKISIQNDTPSSSTSLCSPVSTTAATTHDENAPKEKIQIRLIIEHKNGEDGHHMNLPSLERMLAEKISDIITNKTIDPALHSSSQQNHQSVDVTHVVAHPNNLVPPTYDNLYPTHSDLRQCENDEIDKQIGKKPGMKRQYRQRESTAKKQVMEDWSATKQTNPRSIIRNILTEKSKSHSLTDIHPSHNRMDSEGSLSIAPPLRPSISVARPQQLEISLPQCSPQSTSSSPTPRSGPNTLLSLRQFRPPFINLISPRNSPSSSNLQHTPNTPNTPTTPVSHDNNQPSTSIIYSTPSYIQTNTSLHNISTYSQATNSHDNNLQPMISSTTAIPTPSVYYKPSSSQISCNRISSDSQGYLASLPSIIRSSSTPICLFCRKNRAEFRCSGNCNIVCCGQKDCLQFGQDPKFHQNHS